MGHPAGWLVKCQPFVVDARCSFAAIFTRSARESAFIFRITLPRCAFTVISLMPSSPPTCLFNRPRNDQRHDLPFATAEARRKGPGSIESPPHDAAQRGCTR